MTLVVGSYKLKRIEFEGKVRPILCQNEGGPCPLLAICNVLLLRDRIRFHSDYSEINANDLLQELASYLLEKSTNTETLQAINFQQQLDGAMEVLPRLQNGLDVNVKFTSPQGFEFTEELSTFDLASIALYHGWVVDPQDKHTSSTIGSLSYNQLVEILVEYKAALNDMEESDKCALKGIEIVDKDSPEKIICEPDIPDSAKDIFDQSDVVIVESPNEIESPEKAITGDFVTEPLQEVEEEKNNDTVQHEVQQPFSSVLYRGAVIDKFLTETATQLTYHGLERLHAEVPEGSLSVFFRNNHFSTMYRVNNSLYLLVTDLGYLHNSTAVWEKLDVIDGDTEMVDAGFCPRPVVSRTSEIAYDDLYDADHMLAMQLQQADRVAITDQIRSPNRMHQPITKMVDDTENNDEAFARAIQEQEQSLFNASQNTTVIDNNHMQVRQPGSRGRRWSANCSIQ